MFVQVAFMGEGARSIGKNPPEAASPVTFARRRVEPLRRSPTKGSSSPFGQDRASLVFSEAHRAVEYCLCDA
jgi:hypothetical protein